MFPTRTTSTTGTLRVPPAASHAVAARPAAPQPAAVVPAGPGRDEPRPHPAWAPAEPEPARTAPVAGPAHPEPAAAAHAAPGSRPAWPAAGPEPVLVASAATGAYPSPAAAPQAGPGRGTPAGPGFRPAAEGPRSRPQWPAAAVSTPRAERALPESATAAHGGPAPVSRTAAEGPRSHLGWATELRPAPAAGAQVRAGRAAEPEPVPGPDPRTASAAVAPAGPGFRPSAEGPRSGREWPAAAVSTPRAERAAHPESASAAHGGPAPVSRTAPEGPRSHPEWAAAEPEPVRTAASAAPSRPAPAAPQARPAWAAAEPEPVPGPDFAQVAVAHGGPGRAAQSMATAGVAGSHGSAVAVAVPRPDSGTSAEAPREHPDWEAEALAVASGSSGSSGPTAAAAVGAPREEAGAAAPAETSFGWVAAPDGRSAQADEPVPSHAPEVPAARAQSESESEPAAAAGPEIPHPQHAEAEAAGVATLILRTIEPQPQPQPQPASGPGPGLDPEPEPVAAYPGVPGPGAAEIAAQAVSRALEKPPAEGDSEDVPRFGRRRGTSVTEVPVHLPFRGDPKPMPAPAPAPAPGRSRTTPRPAPGRRVPRGDDRLREHRGPVLPGWVGVAVGGIALVGCTAVLWRAGAVPAPFVAAFGATPRAYHGLRATHWPPLAFLGIVALVALGGLGRARTGHAWVLTLFGRYRGTVRRTGLTWVSPLLLRRRVDVRLRHWRSDPMPAVDSGGLALQVVVQVVWQVKDTARATLAVEDHTEYLAEQVESAMARVLSQLPADAFHEDAPTLRDAEAVGDALTRMLAAETEAVGIEVFSAQPTRIEYAAEVAEAMRRRRVAAIDAKHRDTVLTSVVDAVDDTVHRLTSRGLVELDDYERKALVKDLTVAFYTGRPE
ncbi:SPFH domain-containing protein [Streptomyces sp. NPDC091204]|uniref:SPFH domain-containing protein n=1 Tax=Streptomyces sp. NPDC091204 TaxID=3155299 RepID=UPI0034344EBB